jgi:molybdopterin molybdotransferase
MSELPVDQLLSVAGAIAIIDATPVQPRVQTVPLEQSAGRRLAADIIADRDDPPFDKSLMDGFAVRAGDGDVLQIVGEIAAGAASDRGISAGQAMSIMTGAPIPPGADAVVPVEQTRRQGQAVHVQTMVKMGQSIGRRGSDCAAGAVVLKRGTLLGPAQIAVAASMGAANIEAYARPRVAILSTGDEIVSVNQQPEGSQIRTSNSSMLHALLTRLGCDVHDMGIVRDEPGLIRAELEKGMEHDALFVTGGMSMGEYDYVPQLLLEMGVELRISKLRIKPGKPFVFGVRAGKFVFGLPGNPVSGYVCSLRLAARLLRRMGGGPAESGVSTAMLRSPLPPNGPREFYQPGVLDDEGGIDPLKWKGSADIYTLASGNALIIRAESSPAMPIGAVVGVLRMP